MDSVQVFVKEYHTTLGIEHKTFSYPGGELTITTIIVYVGLKKSQSCSVRRVLSANVHSLPRKLPSRAHPDGEWVRAARKPLSGGAVCPRLRLPGECRMPPVWHGESCYVKTNKEENIQVMACQCYLNFVATNATAASCPRTGVCTHALQLKQVILLHISSIFHFRDVWHL